MVKYIGILVAMAVLFATVPAVMAIGPIYSNQTTNATTMATTIPTQQMNTTNTNYTVKIAYNSTVGYYFTNSTGYTLYIYTKDTPYSGNSTCYGGCAALWPPFYASSLVLPSGLNASNFSTITRTAGAKQLTYKGYPLYFYAADTAPGVVNGQGVGHVWYVETQAGYSSQSALTTIPTAPTNTSSNTTMATSVVSTNNYTTTSVSPPATTTTSSTSGNYTLWYVIGIVIIVILVAAIVMMMRKR